MFRIQFKGDFFKIGKTKGIYDKTNKSFGEEMFPEQEDASSSPELFYFVIDSDRQEKRCLLSKDIKTEADPVFIL